MNKRNILIVTIFSVMFLFLQMQFHEVMVYFDDYGYYSLSYGVSAAHGGNEFTFGELISYLKVHYFDVNGRLPGYLLWLSLYLIGGLTLVQVVAASIVSIILVILWKFIDSKDHAVLSAVLVCAFYGLISIEMHKQGTYWFAAFFQYIAPVATIVLFVHLYFKYRTCELNISKKVILIGLVFLSAYSQEQLSVTVTFMVCLILVYELINKNAKLFHVILLITAAIGVCALLLSPSSQNRAASSGYSFLETIIYSTYKTIRTFFADDNGVFVILLHLAVLSFSLDLYSKDSGIFKLFDFASIAFAVISILIYVLRPVLGLLGEFTLNRYYVLIVVGVPSVAVIAIQIMRYYWLQKQEKNLLLFMTAVGSVGCLCFVPEVPARLFISGWMMLFPLLFDAVISFANHLKISKLKMSLYCIPVIAVAITVLAVINAGQIYYGYALNGEAYRYNDNQLNAVLEKENAGHSVEKVSLKTMPVPECAAIVVYDKEVTYVKSWMRRYYNYTSNPSFYYNASGVENVLSENYINQGNNVFLELNEENMQFINP